MASFRGRGSLAEYAPSLLTCARGRRRDQSTRYQHSPAPASLPYKYNCFTQRPAHEARPCTPTRSSTPALETPATVQSIHMFESFSFAAASRHPSSLDDPDDYAYPDVSISPTSSPVSEQTAMSVAELSRRFGAQNIGGELYQAPASPFELPAPWTEHDDWTSTSASSPTSSYFPDDAFPDPSAIRARRQAHTQLQCDAAHMRDISSLVQKMIESGDQCKLASRNDSVVSSSDCCGDDADDEPYDLPRSNSSPAISQSLRYRRSGEVLSTAAVSKNIRFRRRHPRKMTSHR